MSEFSEYQSLTQGEAASAVAIRRGGVGRPIDLSGASRRDSLGPFTAMASTFRNRLPLYAGHIDEVLGPMPGERLFAQVPSETLRFRFLDGQGNALQRAAAVRLAVTESSSLEVVEGEYGKEEATMRTFGLASFLSETKRRTLQEAGLLEMALESMATLPSIILRRELEIRYRLPVLVNTSNYNANLVQALSSGSEWDHATGGDFGGSVRAAVRLLRSYSGLSLSAEQMAERLELVLTHASYEAALNAPDVRAALDADGTGNASRRATLEDLRRISGVPNIEVVGIQSLGAAGAAATDHASDYAWLQIRPRTVQLADGTSAIADAQFYEPYDIAPGYHGATTLGGDPLNPVAAEPIESEDPYGIKLGFYRTCDWKVTSTKNKVVLFSNTSTLV